MSLVLPERRGERPQTTEHIPHRQISENPSEVLHIETRRRFLALDDTEVGPSRISVPGATALFLPVCKACNPEAFMIDREFAHIHPLTDGSFHMSLPEAQCRTVIEQGWGEWHPYVRSGRLPPTVVMVYAPRDDEEIDVILTIAKASYAYSTTPVQVS
ncbi:MAG: phospholipase [Deltaproteobacteria bacterium]|nr:MAG: phospholipase [Deltaproteobacteria bacterium]